MENLAAIGMTATRGKALVRIAIPGRIASS